jgi:hypothetical protein
MEKCPFPSVSTDWPQVVTFARGSGIFEPAACTTPTHEPPPTTGLAKLPVSTKSSNNNIDPDSSEDETYFFAVAQPERTASRLI